jgi:hypothetical protein
MVLLSLARRKKRGLTALRSRSSIAGGDYNSFLAFGKRLTAFARTPLCTRLENATEST